MQFGGGSRRRCRASGRVAAMTQLRIIGGGLRSGERRRRRRPRHLHRRRPHRRRRSVVRTTTRRARHGRHARRRRHALPRRERRRQRRAATAPGRPRAPRRHAPTFDDRATIPRSGTAGTVPTTFTTGYRYAGLGYTTVFDAAVAPLMARPRTRSSTTRPSSTAASSSLLGNDDYLLRLIDAGERERAREYAAWLLGASGAYAIKVVNPGGVELWKRGSREPNGARPGR